MTYFNPKLHQALSIPCGVAVRRKWTLRPCGEERYSPAVEHPPQEDILPENSYGRWRVSTQGSGCLGRGCWRLRSSKGGARERGASPRWRCKGAVPPLALCFLGAKQLVDIRSFVPATSWIQLHFELHYAACFCFLTQFFYLRSETTEIPVFFAVLIGSLRRFFILTGKIIFQLDYSSLKLSKGYLGLFDIRILGYEGLIQ